MHGFIGSLSIPAVKLKRVMYQEKVNMRHECYTIFLRRVRNWLLHWSMSA